jgi:UDP-2,3-diacylglucosamine pyrophosphatase LpxH
MLILISDIHLCDGTCAKSIAPGAFYLFADRVREMAYHASWRTDNTYKPIESIDLVLMGDILDPLHSTLWLSTQPGDTNYCRPWTDPGHPAYAAMLQKVTRAILMENHESLSILKRMANGEAVRLHPANRQGQPAFDSDEHIALPVRIHYLVGNHDWYYHLPGPKFDAIRQGIIDAMGLSNPPGPFPWEVEEDAALREIFERYKVYGRHGDYYDKFNFNPEAGRNASGLGDVFAMEVLNRFPVEVQRQMGHEIPPAMIDSLRRLVNIRPALATPLWISGQIRRYAGTSATEQKLKEIWDRIGEEFLELGFVRDKDKRFRFDPVDAMQAAIFISKQASFKTINDLVTWVRGKMGEPEISFASHALKEPAFVSDRARFIVYGHTHHHEVISLDTNAEKAPYDNSQVYLNSGTWHSYYDLAIQKPEEQKFIPYQAMTYLTFYRDGERGGRSFEAWSGTYS